MIKAEIVCDSLAPSGVRLTTFVLTYPRFIHAEFMTHRVFSRNASSSRAIPVKKQIKEIMNNPAMPIAFAANKAGMQAGDSFGPLKQWACRVVWRAACYAAVFFAKCMEKLNIHKQYANRILEPFAHITVICTATDFDNFFSLRVHPAAQPEICELATQMWTLYKYNDPKKVSPGYWHLPLVTEDEIKECCGVAKVDCLKDSQLALNLAIKRSVAKCARVSYKNHDGTKNTLKQDLDLFDRLLGNVPIHASPAEHQAEAVNDWSSISGNFRGWTQFRKTLQNECVASFSGPSK